MGLRQGIAFLLIGALAIALVVPLVRHLPLPVLRYGQAVTLVLAGVILVFSDPPVSLLGAAPVAQG